MNSAEKLRLLRQRMQEQGMDAYVVVTDDFHGSEYVGDYFKAREYLSGFTGSAGTLVVLPDSAALWTDGRYFLQAADQLAGSTIDLMRAGQPGVPTIGAFLAQRVPQGGTVGFDGRTVSSLFARTMAAALEGKNVRFAYEQDLAGAVWPDRPALSAQPVWELPAECAGLTREEKLRLLREKMRETGAEVLVLTALDEVAWTLNLRGDDVRCTPVFLSFLLLRQEEATLCVQEQILSGELKEKLVACGVALAPYESIYDRLRAIPAGTAVQTDSATANYSVLQSLSGAKVLDRPSPVQLMKAMKTPAEQENFRAAHIKDGVAVCRFICWLQSHVGKEPITECSAAAKLESFRAQQPDYLGPSFDSIMAFGPHGAIGCAAGAPQLLPGGVRRTLSSGDHGHHPYHPAGAADGGGTPGLYGGAEGPSAAGSGPVPGGPVRAESGYSGPAASVGAGDGLQPRHRPRRGLCARRP